MGDIVIVAYRPKPGGQAALATLVERHVPQLRAWGFATERPSILTRAADGTLVEVFEWRDGAVQQAHGDPLVQSMWSDFAGVCESVPLRTLAETSDMFATFAPM